MLCYTLASCKYSIFSSWILPPRVIFGERILTVFSWIFKGLNCCVRGYLCNNAWLAKTAPAHSANVTSCVAPSMTSMLFLFRPAACNRTTFDWSNLHPFYQTLYCGSSWTRKDLQRLEYRTEDSFSRSGRTASHGPRLRHCRDHSVQTASKANGINSKIPETCFGRCGISDPAPAPFAVAADGRDCDLSGNRFTRNL